MRKTLIICGLLAAGLAGCGSKTDTSGSDYAVRVQSAQFQFANTFEKATNQLLKSSSPGHDAKALRTAAHAVDVNVNTLRSITPPAKVRGLHRQLVTVMQAYGVSLRKAARLVAGGDPKAFIRAKTLLEKSSQTIRNRFNTIIGKINTALL